MSNIFGVQPFFNPFTPVTDVTPFNPLENIGADFGWNILPEVNLITPPAPVQISNSIASKVLDKNGLPVPYVAIQVLGTNLGTTSDFDGNYTIAAGSNETLRFSSLGFNSIDVKASNIGGSVILSDNVEQLNEIVISTSLKEDKSYLGKVMIGTAVVVGLLFAVAKIKDSGLKAAEVTI